MNYLYFMANTWDAMAMAIRGPRVGNKPIQPNRKCSEEKLLPSTNPAYLYGRRSCERDR